MEPEKGCQEIQQDPKASSKLMETELVFSCHFTQCYTQDSRGYPKAGWTCTVTFCAQPGSKSRCGHDNMMTQYRIHQAFLILHWLLCGRWSKNISLWYPLISFLYLCLKYSSPCLRCERPWCNLPSVLSLHRHFHPGEVHHEWINRWPDLV